jgi:type VI secretion system protein ImpH
MSTVLEERFRNFDFLQLVRVLLRPAAPGQPPLEPDEAIRFRADLGAAFPGRNASALDTIPAPRSGEPLNKVPEADAPYMPRSHPLVRVTTPDFCVGSVLGPLPEAFLEWMRDLERAGSHGMRDFLDLFNHRINVLRYKVREAFEPGLGNLIPERTLEAQWLGSLMGVGSEDAASQIPLRARNWLGIGEFLADNRRSEAGVVQVLAAYLRCPVRLEPLIAQWRLLGGANEHALGGRRLGQDSLLGRSVLDVQAAVRLDIGPVSYAAMVELLPAPAGRGAQAETSGSVPVATAREMRRAWRKRQDGTASGTVAQSPHRHEALATLVRLMLDRRHDALIDIHIPEREIPPSVLAANPAPGQAGLRLGQTAWLKSRSRVGRPRRGPRGLLRTVRLEVKSHHEEPFA